MADTKIHVRAITGLNVKPQKIKFLEENGGKNLHVLWFMEEDYF
jgi:hypothetical protein